MKQNIHYDLTIPEALDGKRLDAALGQLIQEYSRATIQSWISEGWVQVNHQIVKVNREKLHAGQQIIINAETQIHTQAQAQSIPLEIIFEDEALIIINKPAGLVVHPGAGNPNNTLMNALLHHCPILETVPRAGIIHRIDKDTTGLMVIAKSLIAQNALIKQMQERMIKREYEAIVIGQMTGGGVIEAPIGRHPKLRTKMAVTKKGKEAVTHYRVIEKFLAHTHIKAMLETGRTHQIRVHMAHIGYPLVGDKTYGTRAKLPPNATQELIEVLQQFKRQALHAKTLSLIHPLTEEVISWTVGIPEDMQSLLELLRNSNPG